MGRFRQRQRRSAVDHATFPKLYMSVPPRDKAAIGSDNGTK
jgi:hypothetical protein